ncbi:MAG: hypothetical protein Q8P90_04590 [bacterium]|nr:hypothetical protein [bacterium]
MAKKEKETLNVNTLGLILAGAIIGGTVIGSIIYVNINGIDDADPVVNTAVTKTSTVVDNQPSESSDILDIESVSSAGIITSVDVVPEGSSIDESSFGNEGNSTAVETSVEIVSDVVDDDPVLEDNISVDTAIDVKADETASNQDIELPVVVYSRDGLLSVVDKAQLEIKLINPYVDYQADSEYILVSMMIEVPEQIGEPYSVDAIFAGGISEGFLFGQHGEDYNFWFPSCMYECSFTDEYRLKYPEVVDLSW